MTGHPQPRRTSAWAKLPIAGQRRIPLLSLAVLLALVLLMSAGLLAAGCGTEATTTTAAPATTASTAAPDETTTTAAAETTTTAAGQPAEGTFPVTVTDDNGNSVTIEAKPARIVSTAPASTETLFAVGAGDRVVGVTSLDDYPAEVANIAKIGDFQANAEAVMGQSPDLVIAYSGNEEALAPVQAECPVIFFNPANLEGIYANITTVGAVTGNTGQAATLVESLKSEIQKIKDAAGASGSAPKVFYALDNTLWTAGPGSFVDELLKMVNAVNVGSMPGSGNAAAQQYYQFAAEQLIAADPDIILLPNTAFLKGIEEFTEDPRFAALTAVKDGKVFIINDTIVTRPGPRIAEGIKALLEAVHPGAL